MPKVFENIYNLEFDLKDSVMGIVSREGEICKLRSCYLRGEEVEEWMKLLEEQMQQSVIYYIRQAIMDYDKDETLIQQWVLNHNSQAVQVNSDRGREREKKKKTFFFLCFMNGLYSPKIGT